MRTWLFDKSNGVCFVQRWLVYSALEYYRDKAIGSLSLPVLQSCFPITAVRWPSFGNDIENQLEFGLLPNSCKLFQILLNLSVIY